MPISADSPRVLFFEPPLNRQTGGLQAALESLRTALPAAGIEPVVSSSIPEKLDPRVIAHFQGLWQPSHAGLAAKCRARGIPYLVSTHGMLEPWAWHHKRWKKRPYFYLIERRYLARARCLLATAEAEARNLAVFFPNTDIQFIPLGMTGDARPDYSTARLHFGWRDDEWILLFLSRIHEKKGLELLLDALADSESARPSSLRLVIVGGGAPRYVNRLKAQCAAKQARLPRIEWHGERWGKEKWKYFQGADLFCLPSHSENFGLAVLDACQVGTPPVTTTATPWSSMLTEGRGYIAAPDAQSVEGALRKAFQDGKADIARRESIARWAHTNFSWDRLAVSYSALYRKIASTR